MAHGFECENTMMLEHNRSQGQILFFFGGGVFGVYLPPQRVANTQVPRIQDLLLIFSRGEVQEPHFSQMFRSLITTMPPPSPRVMNPGSAAANISCLLFNKAIVSICYGQCREQRAFWPVWVSTLNKQNRSVLCRSWRGNPTARRQFLPVLWAEIK